MQWATGMLRSMLYQQLHHFTECWVPDVANPSASLSAALGHPSVLPKVPVHYMGWLTRFENDATISKKMESDILILLSGPEPQRTLLEDMLLKQLPNVQQQVLLVRGLPNEKNIPEVAAHVQVKNHLPAKDLQTAMQQSSFVISRGGYSTLMDAFTLQKKCIFIPTPGQTEQEYLCKTLQQQQAALCYAQPAFQLTEALQQAETFSFQLPTVPTANMLSAFVEAALRRLQQ
jgi:predicted glycosyltransferase